MDTSNASLERIADPAVAAKFDTYPRSVRQRLLKLRSLILETAAADVPPGLDQLVSDTAIEQTATAFTDPWMRYFLAYDPQPALQALMVPVLAVIGGLDLQVSAELNVPALQTALADNPDATVLALSDLNHLFQTATTGAISEYAQIEETFAPEAMELVSDWILARF